MQLHLTSLQARKPKIQKSQIEILGDEKESWAKILHTLETFAEQKRGRIASLINPKLDAMPFFAFHIQISLVHFIDLICTDWQIHHLGHIHINQLN